MLSDSPYKFPSLPQKLHVHPILPNISCFLKALCFLPVPQLYTLKALLCKNKICFCFWVGGKEESLNIPCSAHLSLPIWEQDGVSCGHTESTTQATTANRPSSPKVMICILEKHQLFLPSSKHIPVFFLQIPSFSSCHPITTILTCSPLFHHTAAYSIILQFTPTEMELATCWWLVLQERVVDNICFTNILVKSDNTQFESILLDSPFLNLGILHFLFWAEVMMCHLFLQWVSNTIFQRNVTGVFPKQTR